MRVLEPRRWRVGYSDGHGLSWDGDGIETIGVWEGLRCGIPIERRGHEVDGGIQGGLPVDDLATIGSHSTHDGGQRAVRAIGRFIVLGIGPDGGEQVVVLLLIGIDLFIAAEAPCIGAGDADDMSADIGVAFGADTMLGDAAPSAADMAALAEHTGAILEFVLAGVMIVNLAEFFAGADLATAHAMDTDGVIVLDPTTDIQVVDVLFVDVIAAKPVEVIPVAHLIFDFGLAFLARIYPDAAIIPINAQGVDIANSPVVQALQRLEVTGLMMALESDANLEVLAFGFGGGSEDFADAWGVHSHGFLHEDVLALADGFLEMDRAKTGRCCQNDHIGERDGFFVGVKTDELAVGGDVYLGAMRFLQVFEGAVETVFEGVGHGNQLGAWDIECLACRTRTASTTPDQSDFQRIIAGRMRGLGDTERGDRSGGGLGLRSVSRYDSGKAATGCRSDKVPARDRGDS
jgi:hypothetical protein